MELQGLCNSFLPYTHAHLSCDHHVDAEEKHKVFHALNTMHSRQSTVTRRHTLLLSPYPSQGTCSSDRGGAVLVHICVCV